MASATGFFDFKVKDSKLYPTMPQKPTRLHAASNLWSIVMTSRQPVLALPALHDGDGDDDGVVPTSAG